jgi:glycerol-3-phosphate dehydrogenase
VERIVGEVAGGNAARRVRLVKGSHLIAKKFWDGPQAYLLQGDDKRVIFVNPYEGDLCLIGTTDIPYEGAPEAVAMQPDEIDYLLRIVNRYMRPGLASSDIVATFSGVRPLYDDKAGNPSAVTRDYEFDVDDVAGKVPMLSVFGGKITTYRKLAEHALEKLAPYFPRAGKPWTARAPLPGGDMPGADFARFLAGLRQRRPWLPGALALHCARLYGTRSEALLGDATSLADLGRHFGGLLYEREADFLMREEWAVAAPDILQRRTKHGLHLSVDERAAFAAWMAARRHPLPPGEG